MFARKKLRVLFSPTGLTNRPRVVAFCDRHLAPDCSREERPRPPKNPCCACLTRFVLVAAVSRSRSPSAALPAKLRASGLRRAEPVPAAAAAAVRASERAAPRALAARARRGQRRQQRQVDGWRQRHLRGRLERRRRQLGDQRRRRRGRREDSGVRAARSAGVHLERAGPAQAVAPQRRRVRGEHPQHLQRHERRRAGRHRVLRSHHVGLLGGCELAARARTQTLRN